MKNRVFSLLLVLALLAGLLPSAAWAAEDETEWVEIDTVEGLLSLADSGDPATLSKRYRLTADLDLAEVDFPGIGSAQTPFTGVFDGQDHTVANTTVTGEENVGFFNVLLGGAVKNLTLTDVTVSGSARVGGLAGWLQDEQDGEDTQDGTVCMVDHCAVSGTVSGEDTVGGFVGLSAGVVQSCYSLVDVTGTGDGPVGGFAGSIGAVEDSMSAGRVTGGAGFAGTLTGRVAGLDSEIDVKNVFGNCIPDLAPVGNADDFTTEDQHSALAAMTLESETAVATKLYEMFGVRLPALERPDLTGLMDAIAAKLTEEADGWTVLDMALYQSLEGKTVSTTPAARQAALDAMIQEAAGEKATASDRARLELTLRAIGVDSTKLYPAGGAAVVDNAAALSKMELSGLSHYSAPWLLLAELQGNVTLTTAQREELVALLETNMGDGLFGYEWDGVTYSSPDTAGTVLAALAALYETDDRAREVADAILAALPGGMDETGSFGNANADAMVVIGLIALGRDPWELTAPSGASVVDGLLSHVNETEDGFLYAGEPNALATEQGFRALVALALFDGQQPYHIYDFHTTAVTPGRATGSGQSQNPGQPSGQNRIKVTLSLRTDTETWIDRDSLSLRTGSTVYHALEQALSKHSMTAEGLTEGYIKSVTKNGVTLAQFDKGPNSGWLYQVNGTAPTVSFADYTLKNGDTVLWYYTADWTGEPDTGTTGGGTSTSTPAKESDDRCPQDETCPVARFADADPKAWYHDGVHYCVEKGLMRGTSATAFGPEGLLDRAMLVTMLYRAAGEPSMPEANWGYPYADVDAAAYYATAVYWARRSGVAGGYGNGGFGPEDPVTREQLALMLWRQAGSPAVQGSLLDFQDGEAVSPWAVDALRWAVERGILTGKSGRRLDPAGHASRAETAVMLQRCRDSET